MSLLETFNWPKAAEEFSKKIPLDQLHPECVSFLLKHEGEPWGIACSGGGDSLSLLLLIYNFFLKKVNDITVFHYNDKLRGKESDNEEAFVRNCCNALNLNFICGEGDPLVEDRSEGALRKSRHHFFNESLKTIGGNILLLGHQKEDVAEMMLMRLARGSGTGGLCAPRPIHFFVESKVHVRPLLNLSKKFLLDKLEEVEISWCIDSSNEGDYYFRNRIRRYVIPEWEAACVGDLWKGIERSRELLEEDDNALEDFLAQIIDLSKLKDPVLDLSVFIGKPKALYRRALHKWLQANEISKHFNSASFDILLKNVLDKKDFQMSAGIARRVRMNEHLLILETQKSGAEVNSFFEKKIEVGVTIELLGGHFLEVEEVLLNNELKEKIFRGEVDPNYEVYLKFERTMDFWVRLWQAGDRYKAIGSSGSRKLQDMFTDRKIGIEKRKILPIIIEKRYGIAWCPGLPIAEVFKIDESTIFALKLTYK